MSNSTASSLGDIRSRAIRFFVIFLWAHVPIVAAMSYWTGANILITSGFVAVIALVTTLDWRRNPTGNSAHYTAAAGLALTVAMFVYAFKGHPWQIDMHMYFFAALALTAVFCNWRVVLVFSAIVAVHHLVLNFTFPAWVFPEGANFARVVLHALIVVVQTVAMIWLVSVIEKAIQSATDALEEAHAAKDDAGRMAEELRQADQKASKDRAVRREQLASSFDSDVNSAVKSLLAAMEQAERAVADAMELNRQTESISSSAASASQVMGENVRTVAAASEELASSATEIGRRIADLTQIAQEASDASKQTSEKGRSLSDNSKRIEEVIGLIADIAEQTNLLALNATIEAARAGESGKGFAVVANEVKGLATQTAQATEDVRKEVTAIVEAIGEVASALDAVDEKNMAMSKIFTSVASAVEQQMAATQEIARNTQEAAVGTDELGQSVEAVQQATTESSQKMQTVMTVNNELTEITQSVGSKSNGFLEAIRQ